MRWSEGGEERRDDEVNGRPLIDKVARATMSMPSVEIQSRERGAAR